MQQIETTAVLKKTAQATRYLAELKGVALSIPNESILINTLVLQEAKNSSEIENIITTHDELFKITAYKKNKVISKMGLIDKIHAKKQIPLPNRHFSCYFDRRVICFNFT